MDELGYINSTAYNDFLLQQERRLADLQSQAIHELHKADVRAELDDFYAAVSEDKP